MTEQPDYVLGYQRMKKLLQESEDKIRRYQAEEEIRKMAEKIYEITENLRIAKLTMTTKVTTTACLTKRYKRSRDVLGYYN